jgi:hypothetical protein
MDLVKIDFLPRRNLLLARIFHFSHVPDPFSWDIFIISQPRNKFRDFCWITINNSLKEAVNLFWVAKGEFQE